MNLLNGLAISDTNMILAEAKKFAIISKVEKIYMMEIIGSRSLSLFENEFRHNKIVICPDDFPKKNGFLCQIQRLKEWIAYSHFPVLRNAGIKSTSLNIRSAKSENMYKNH